MTAFGENRAKGRRANILDSYTERLGDALRRHQSAVALKAARVDAELAYRARGAFLASMNHELRTPLNAITGFAGLLKHAGEGDIPHERQVEYLDFILQSADLLLSHINTILEIADAESGGTKLSRRAFDLKDVCEQVIEGFEDRAAAGAPMTLVLDAPEATPPVDADPDKIGVALRHLIAFLRGPAREAFSIKVTIRAGLAGQSADFVYVALESDAPPYSAAQIQAAFRVFERVYEGLDRRFEEQNLGLPIAKSYIDLNGGRFSIKTLPNDTTLVRFALPIAKSHRGTFERIAS